MQTKQIAIAVGIVIVISVVSWQVGYKSGYNSGWNKAKEVVQKSGLIPQANITQTTVLAGTIETVNSQSFSLKTFSADPFASTDLLERTVNIDQNTVIEKLKQKDQAEFQKELKIYTEKTKTTVPGANGVSPSDYPMPFTKEKIALKDIKSGDRATVMSGENIATAKQFTATSVQVQSSMVPQNPLTPPVPPPAR